MARHATRLAERWTGRTLLPVDHPPGSPVARYGHGRPPHAGLLEILRRGEPSYRSNLETIAGYSEDLVRIASEPDGPLSPPFANAWLPGLDSAALYGFLRARRPRLYVEVGSGISTRFARRAIEDGEAATRVVSIDPHPRADVEALCDRAVREPLEAVDLAIFDDLAAGDVLFMDGSHHVFTNSDATVFFLDVLPSLPAGVLVAVHDVLLPDDYLPMWEGYHWSEQYLMATYLLGGGRGIELELAASYVTAHSDAHRILDPLWECPQLAGVDRRGFALWFSTTAPAAEPDRPDH